jgi:hypothetical protein
VAMRAARLRKILIDHRRHILQQLGPTESTKQDTPSHQKFESKDALLRELSATNTILSQTSLKENLTFSLLAGAILLLVDFLPGPCLGNLPAIFSGSTTAFVLETANGSREGHITNLEVLASGAGTASVASRRWAIEGAFRSLTLENEPDWRIRVTSLEPLAVVDPDGEILQCRRTTEVDCEDCYYAEFDLGPEPPSLRVTMDSGVVRFVSPLYFDQTYEGGSVRHGRLTVIPTEHSSYIPSGSYLLLSGDDIVVAFDGRAVSATQQTTVSGRLERAELVTKTTGLAPKNEAIATIQLMPSLLLVIAHQHRTIAGLFITVAALFVAGLRIHRASAS